MKNAIFIILNREKLEGCSMFYVLFHFVSCSECFRMILNRFRVETCHVTNPEVSKNENEHDLFERRRL